MAATLYFRYSIKLLDQSQAILDVVVLGFPYSLWAHYEMSFNMCSGFVFM
jgi:hypothetical protein